MSRWILLSTLIACGGARNPTSTMGDAAMSAPIADPAVQVLMAPWSGPLGGVPPLDRAEVEAFVPAVRAAMAAHRAAVAAIASDPSPPTVENTLEAYERAGDTLGRVLAVYGAWTATMSDDAVREAQATLSPELAAHRSALRQDEVMYGRLKTLAEREDLTDTQQRLVADWLRAAERGGVALPPEQRARVAAIQAELAGLYSTFANNVLAEEEAHRTRLGPDDLDGLPQSWLDAARDPDQADTWWVRNTRSSVDPFLTFSTRRDLREQVWRRFYARGDNGDEHDNKALIRSILKLRAERARLLGYPSFAHLVLADTMAKTPDAALALLERVWTPAVAKFRDEVAAMQALVDERGEGFQIAAWDVKHYAEQIRERDHDLEARALTPYLQVERLREAMFWAAGELYGFRFVPAEDVPVQHPDVRVWEVRDADDRAVGLWYFDPFARPGKRSGAWMNAYRVQQHLDGALPIVTNQSNFVKGTGDAPVTISWDDAETLFHEFGHALHGLASDVRYPSQAGTNTTRDFVEFPSQLNEAWLSTPELLGRFALHVETGEPMPQALIQRLEAAANAASGFRTTELLASAIADMRLHLLPDGDVDAAAFEAELKTSLQIPDEIVLRHRLPHFGHVFAGEGYAAGYYSYLWSDVLTADAEEAFAEAPGGLYDADVAGRYFQHVLSVGDTVDPAEAYRNFRGRDPDVDALLRKRGFPTR